MTDQAIFFFFPIPPSPFLLERILLSGLISAVIALFSQFPKSIHVMRPGLSTEEERIHPSVLSPTFVSPKTLVFFFALSSRLQIVPFASAHRA